MEIKQFSASIQVKTQLTEWKKMLANHLSDKEYVHKLYRTVKTQQQQQQQQITQLKNGQKI